MPVGGKKQETEDPRIAELREVNARIKTVISFLKAKHTPRSIDTEAAAATTYKAAL